jgi:hypothetical protein
MDFATALLGGTSLVSGGLNLFGANKQAQATKDAANQQQMMQMLALQQQQQQYQQNRADLAPYRDFGQTAGNQLINRLPELTQGFDPSQANLEQTPGYQWNLQQTLKAGQNSAAARGLGVSGAALKGAEKYATGLASQTQDQQANLFFANQNNAYNKLYGVTGLGASAAGATVSAGQNNMNQQSNLLTGMGSVGAAGTIGSAASMNQGLGSVGQSVGNLPLMYYYGQRSGGGATPAAAPSGMYGASDYYSAAGQAPWGSYGPGF